MSARSNTADDRLSRVHIGDLLERWVLKPLSVLAFWSAIALPVLYLPLFLTGPDTADELGVVLGLVGLHVIALFVGRSHYREPEQFDDGST